ncbi:MAG: glycosyltransferase family 39 protein [Candidatus Omnitrophica bacterium]|nr:glycosyltransferase family 39 protein [Candidatus Omnitrophota bacterium]
MKDILKKTGFWLVLIMLLALFLRVYGINWGLPDKDYYFSYHSDEVNYLKGLSQMDPKKLDFNPHFFNWGTWHYFELGLVMAAASLTGMVRLIKLKDFYYAHPWESAKLYLVGRFLSVFFALLTVYLVYRIGKRIFKNDRIALFSAFFMAINPAHILSSHYLKADTSVTFWITASLFFSLCLLDTGRLKYYILSGLFSGIAMSAQQNGIFFAHTLFCAHILRELTFKPPYPGIKRLFSGVKLWAGYLFLVLSYLAASPYLYLSPAEFMGGFKRIITGQGGGVDFVLRPNLLLDTFRAFNGALTIFFTIIILVGLIRVFFSRRRRELLILFWAAPYLFTILSMAALNIRYQLPIFPGLLLIGAIFIDSLYRKAALAKLRVFLTLTIIFFSLHAIVYSYVYDREMAREPIQKEATGWMLSNISPGSVIGIGRNPEIRNCPTIIHQDYYYKEKALYNIVNLEFNALALKQKRPEYIVISKREGFAESGGFDLLENSDFLQALDSDYDVIKIFQRSPRFLSMELKPSISISDWELTFPVIYILKRNGLA